MQVHCDSFHSPEWLGKSETLTKHHKVTTKQATKSMTIIRTLKQTKSSMGGSKARTGPSKVASCLKLFGWGSGFICLYEMA